ncbi:MAG: hypothetical protein IPN24_03340 [Betaproteobacteria bacterium]|nr:hypothetical protein [Betaproteobacteria bacterium]
MNGLRTIVFSLLSLALAAFAAPGFAQNKTFTLGATGSINAGTSKTVSITFKNADTGNSSFNSVTITGTPGAVKITGASTSSAKKGTPSAFGSNSLTITDLSPTKVGATLTVTLTVSANAGDCANGTIYWSGGAWTGSPSTPSNPFTQANTDVKTIVNAASCTVSTNVPKDAYVNQVVSTLALTPPAVPTPTALRVTVVRNGAAAADGWHDCHAGEPVHQWQLHVVEPVGYDAIRSRGIRLAEEFDHRDRLPTHCNGRGCGLVGADGRI